MKKLMIAILMVAEVCYSRPINKKYSVKKDIERVLKNPIPDGIEISLTKDTLTINGTFPDGNCKQVIKYKEDWIETDYSENGTAKHCKLIF